MQAGPRLLLQDLSTSRTSSGDLRAIANDARTPGEITDFSGLAPGHVSQYLSILQERALSNAASRSPGGTLAAGPHHIMDPYLRFYYRFLASRQYAVARASRSSRWRRSSAIWVIHRRQHLGRAVPGMAPACQRAAYTAPCG